MTFISEKFPTGKVVLAALALGVTILVPAGCSKAPPGALASVTTAPPTDKDPSPVRMARVSYETGKVSWRPDGSTGWGAVAVNLPLRQGAEVWLAPGSRLELQFDDGATVHLGDDAVATIQTLYSDHQGEFTEVKLSAGTSSWDLKNKYSIYQIDAPCDSVKSTGPSDFRVDIKPKADSLALRSGDAILTADGKDTPITANHAVVMHTPDDPVVEEPVGDEDSWDHFSDNRNALLAETPAHVPTDIALVSGGLNRDGDWHNVENTGWVWTPREERGWRPYHHGHWAWVDPYGWTWVSAESWGWAPYHYGAWGHYGFGWGWAPGPAVQYWSPARVDFAEQNGYVTWAPLAPEEVAYPAFSVGFGGSDWSVNFSIGECGVYEPFGAGICDPVAYPWSYYGSDSRRDGWGRNGWGQGNFAANSNQFIPRNAAYGAVSVSERGFSGGGAYNAINGNATGTFRNGRQATANREAFSGPVGERPSQTAFTPGGAIVSNARPAALNRSLVRGPLPSNVARASGSFGSEARSSSRVASAMPGRGTTMPSGARAPNSVTAARDSLGFRGKNGAVSAGPMATRTTASGRAPGIRASNGANARTSGREGNPTSSVHHMNAVRNAAGHENARQHTQQATRTRTQSANTARRTSQARPAQRRSTARPTGNSGGTRRSNGGNQQRAHAQSRGQSNRGGNQGARSQPRAQGNRGNSGGQRQSGGNKGGGGNRGGGGTKGGGGNDKKKGG